MEIYKGFFSPAALAILLLFIVGSCGEDTYQPKPKGYFRLDFPEKEYRKYEGDCPFTFEFPVYANITPYRDESRNCWFNMDFRGQHARIHFSYVDLEDNLSQHVEDSRKLAYKHTVKALDIEEKMFRNELKNVYSICYNIYGNTASSIQFFITDSSSQFLRGALYFSSQPNADSLSPSIDFIGKDIQHFIETFEWK